MKLYGISDLHLGYEPNQRALSDITSHPADWLILAVDVGETAAHLELAFKELKPRFAKLVWVQAIMNYGHYPHVKRSFEVASSTMS
jgi:hypothetical protein